MQQLTVVAPLLQFLRVRWCFTNVACALNPSQPVARISAPLLEKLEWMCDFVPSSVQLGEMPPDLRRLVAGFIMVYGSDCIAPHNRCCIGILQRFERLSALRLCLAYPPVSEFALICVFYIIFFFFLKAFILQLGECVISYICLQKKRKEKKNHTIEATAYVCVLIKLLFTSPFVTPFELAGHR